MNKPKIGKYIPIGIIILFGIYLIWGVSDRKEKLTKLKTYYTVGKIIDYKRGAKVSPSWIYEFYDGEKIREVSHFMDDNFSGKSDSDWKPYIGKKFFVKYSAIKPLYNEIYLDRPAPDSIIKCNNCKFDKMPTK